MASGDHSFGDVESREVRLSSRRGLMTEGRICATRFPWSYARMKSRDGQYYNVVDVNLTIEACVAWIRCEMHARSPPLECSHTKGSAVPFSEKHKYTDTRVFHTLLDAYLGASDTGTQ